MKDDIITALADGKRPNPLINAQLDKINRVHKYLQTVYKDYQEKANLLLEPEHIGLKVAEHIKEQRKLWF